MRKKVKLEFFDKAGVKHTLSIEGDITIDKITKLLEYAEIVAGGAPAPASSSQSQNTKIKRLLDLISTQLADESFDSRQLWKAYAETWGDDFSLGAVSTYLSRLVDRGVLVRDGSSAHWLYRVKPSQMLPQ